MFGESQQTRAKTPENTQLAERRLLVFDGLGDREVAAEAFLRPVFRRQNDVPERARHRR
jgi:hypothetical protein